VHALSVTSGDSTITTTVESETYTWRTFTAPEVITPGMAEGAKLLPIGKNAFGVDLYEDPNDSTNKVERALRRNGFDIPKTIRSWRGQTDADSRPNKYMRPNLYDQYLEGYELLDELKQIANVGVIPPLHPGYKGMRPCPPNYRSAEVEGRKVRNHLRKREGNVIICHTQRENQ
jgi:hypothetical protein